MKSAFFFFAGMLAGGVLLHTVTAQRTRPTAVSHIGIVTPDYDKMYKFYTDVLGLKEAYTVKNNDGTPLLTYLQANRETFVELIPARNGEKTGVTHYGLEVGSIDATVRHLREKGYTVADPGTTPAHARYTRAHDPDNIEIEVMEFGPDAFQRKAMDSWKP